jgi:hypothetical protein
MRRGRVGWTMSAQNLSDEGRQMAGAAGLEQHDPDCVRPDLPTPLAPVSRPLEIARFALLGLREPSFGRARNLTLVWLTVSVVTLVASQTIVARPYEPSAVAIAVAITAYTVLRTLALILFEIRQRAYESTWIGAESQRLQRYSFELIRFSLHSDGEASGARRTFDLTNPDDVRLLQRQQAAERDGRTPARAHIEFAYRPGDGENPAIESVRREVKDLEFHPIDGPLARARVRFPQAVYVSRPGDQGGGSGWPSQVAHWFLTGPVRLITASPSRRTLGAPAAATFRSQLR